MSDSDKKFMLRVRSTLAYGQDFLDAHIRMAPGFVTLQKDNGTYPVELAERGSVVVGQNPDDEEESRALNYLGLTNPTAVCIHCQWDYYSDKQKENISRALENAAIGITPAKFSTSNLESKFGSVRWETVDGCVDTSLFYPSTEEERKAYRRELGLAEDDKLVVFTGRLEAAKGTTILGELCKASPRDFAVLIQYPAWQHVRQKQRLFQSYLDICEELFALPNVVFFPDAHPRICPRPVRFADVFVSTSLSEVQPLVLLEALACGVPFVGTDSTPEYEHLRQRFKDNPELSSAIRTVDLPDHLRQGATSRSSDVSAADAKVIANKLAGLINDTAIADDARRAELSRDFVAHGFTVPDREVNFRQALENVNLNDPVL